MCAVRRKSIVTCTAADIPTSVGFAHFSDLAAGGTEFKTVLFARPEEPYTTA